ncbi:MAG: hypothetical protein NC184_04370 [Roseburia sp.]|nr:hypothetical protein [Roseburia sp.]
MAKSSIKSENITVVNSHRKANIAVIIVVSIAALILIAITVLSFVRVDPIRGLEEPTYYNFYDLDSTECDPTNSESQSKIRVAMEDMKFSVMSAVLQWKWDYSYNFKRNSSDEKISISADAVKAISATTSEYMVEYVYSPVKIENGVIDYSTAQSLKVDGETVYFDRVKVLVGDTDGKVGTISLYPYIYARLDNDAEDEDLASDTYEVTGINVRANTSDAYAAFKDLAESLVRA